MVQRPTKRQAKSRLALLTDTFCRRALASCSVRPDRLASSSSCCCLNISSFSSFRPSSFLPPAQGVHTTEGRWLLTAPRQVTSTHEARSSETTACVARLLLQDQECVGESLTKTEQRLGLDCGPPAGTALHTQRNSSSRF